MKKSFVAASILLFTVLSVFSALRLKAEEEVLKSPLLAHVYHGHDEERPFTFEVMVSSRETHHLLEEAIEEVRLAGADGKILALALEGIHHAGSVRFAERRFHRYRIEVSPRLVMPEGAIRIDEARLELVYASHAPLSIPVGSFVHVQKPKASSELELRSLRNVPGDLGTGTTSLGLIAAVENVSGKEVCVEDITIHAGGIHVDSGNLVHLDEEKDRFIGVDGFIADYDHLGKPQAGSFCIGAHGRARFFVPFTYETADVRLFRYPLTIRHESEAGGGELTIEDFPFIRTDPFIEESRGGLRRVTLD